MSNNNWQYLPPMGVGGSGATNQGGGGGGYQVPAGYRNALDAARAGVPRTPGAEYPDGYLGTITDRREDKLLDAVSNKLTDRSYQRGVHVGSKIPNADYFWPEWFNPATGLEYESAGAKFAPKGNIPERLAHMGKVPWTSPEELGKALDQYDIANTLARPLLDPVRQAQLQRYKPPWN